MSSSVEPSIKYYDVIIIRRIPHFVDLMDTFETLIKMFNELNFSISLHTEFGETTKSKHPRKCMFY